MAALTTSDNMRLTLSGHETFHCRHLWLKKGYDFVREGHAFADADAVVTLGVGKNMVTAIKFWLKAFDVLGPNDQLTEFAHFLFDNEAGIDPYLEDDQSLWLLHYKLVKNNFASIYSLVFNEFRKEKMQFTKENFQAFVLRKSEQVNPKTAGDDFDVFKKMYLNKSEDNKLTEDSFLGLLADLQLLKSQHKGSYFIVNSDRSSLSPAVFLYAVLDNEQFGASVSLQALENDENGPGNIFALSRNAILELIDLVKEQFGDDYTFNDHAGVKEFQVKKRPSDIYNVLKPVVL
ncbi:DUF4007 family protein [Rubrolithibacter danxiaensis]|uniref:DUF4007 family protein n=1 Tax=Rubrolithibacter danxiaensis TaxID=3390805 RepID=UPI003BF7B14D